MKMQGKLNLEKNCVVMKVKEIAKENAHKYDEVQLGGANLTSLMEYRGSEYK